MGLFEHFPYTNFHELNLDWILRTLRKMDGRLDELQKFIQDLKIPEAVKAQLQEWLEDGTLDDIINEGLLQELNDKIDTAISATGLQMMTTAPNYIGDYLALSDRYFPSAALKHGDRAYLFDAVKEAYGLANATDQGRVLIYSISGNNRERVVPIQCGHCNSVAYDANLDRFYIAPVWTYAGGQRLQVSYLITYTSDFSSEGQVNIPSPAMSVSFDPVDGQLYYFDYSWRIWRYNYQTNTFELYSTVNHDNVAFSLDATQRYNQDFTIYDRRFYISAPRGNILTGVLQEGESNVKYGFNVGHACSNNNYYLGELEGMEFDETGHLIASMYTTISASLYTGFMVEIETGITPPYIPGQAGVYAVNNDTVYVTGSTDLSQAVYEVRSLNQLRMMSLKPTRILIQADADITEPAPVGIYDDVMLTIEGTYRVPALNVFKGELLLYASANGPHTLQIDSGSGIYIQRGGLLRIAGTQGVRLNMILPNNVGVYVGTEFPRTVVRNLPVKSGSPDAVLTIGSTVPLTTALYYGTQKVTEFTV